MDRARNSHIVQSGHQWNYNEEVPFEINIGHLLYNERITYKNILSFSKVSEKIRRDTGFRSIYFVNGQLHIIPSFGPDLVELVIISKKYNRFIEYD